MDTEDIRSDLQALSKLYGLLKSDRYTLQNDNSENDDKSRLLLRNLLDAAAERTFKAHAEILAAREEESKEMLKLQPLPFLHTQKAGQVISSENSELKIFSSQPQVRKRCRVCQRSKAKQLKSYDPQKYLSWGIPYQPHDLSFQFGQINLSEKGLLSSQKALQTDCLNERSELQNIGYSACSSEKPSANKIVEEKEVLKKPEEADEISKEAIFKIQQIESRISDLQVTSKSENLSQIQYEPMSSSDPGTESASSRLQPKRRLVTKNNLSQFSQEFGTDLKSRPISQKVWGPTQWHQAPVNQEMVSTLEPLSLSKASQNVGRMKGISFEYDNKLSEVEGPVKERNLPRPNNVRVIIDRIESVSEVRSRENHMPTQTRKLVQHSRIPAIENENFDLHQSGLKKTGFVNVGTSQPSTPSVRSKFGRRQPSDADSELSRRTQTKVKTRMPDQKITRKINLLDYKPPQHRVGPREKDRQKNDQFSRQRLISPSEEVSESTGSRSVYSSSWSSQQVSNSFSDDDEEYSVSSQTHSNHFSGSSTSNVGPNVSRSTSESEIYSYSVSSRSRDYYPLDSESSGESQDDYTSSDETSIQRSTTDHTKRFEKKQEPGRLKKLKDKLAIIFHHHHHHHHHHHGHNDDDDSESGPHVVVKGGKALWKHAGKILDRKKEEGYGEKAVKKVRKSGKPDKNQRGHFHALVDGLLQHVRHSKKSKPPKGGGGKKAASKLHWWQMIGRQKGSKMGKKARGKVRVGRRNPRLKALPEP